MLETTALGDQVGAGRVLEIIRIRGADFGAAERGGRGREA